MDRAALIRGEGHPGGRAPAPGDLRRVQDLVNTVDRENAVDVFDSRAGAQAWLDHRGLPGRAHLARMVAVREALRALLLREDGGTAQLAADVLAETARRGRLAPDVLAETARRGRLAPDFASGTLRAGAGGLDGTLAEIVGIAFLAHADGRLKACPRSVCRWAFYDRSPNARATWCAMELCGNREKAAAHQARRVSRRSRAGP